MELCDHVANVALSRTTRMPIFLMLDQPPINELELDTNCHLVDRRAGGPHLSAPPRKRVPHISLLRCGFAGSWGSTKGWWKARLSDEASWHGGMVHPEFRGGDVTARTYVVVHPTSQMRDVGHPIFR